MENDSRVWADSLGVGSAGDKKSGTRGGLKIARASGSSRQPAFQWFLGTIRPEKKRDPRGGGQGAGESQAKGLGKL